MRNFPADSGSIKPKIFESLGYRVNRLPSKSFISLASIDVRGRASGKNKGAIDLLTERCGFPVRKVSFLPFGFVGSSRIESV